MKRGLRIAALTLTGLLCLTFAVYADGATVQGQVYNGTAGATSTPGDLPVRLFIFNGDSLKDTPQTTTDAQGIFRFEGLPTGSGLVAVAVVEYAGVSYESEMLELTSPGNLNADVAIYETTTDDNTLSVEQSHLVIEMGAGRLELAEVLTLVNNGDRTYIGTEEVVPGQRATARLPLPVGATDISLGSPEADYVVRTDDGLVDTRPVTPGSQQYRLSYVLPCEEAEYALSKRAAYPTAMLDVLIAAPGARVEAPGLAEMGTRETTGLTYVHYGGQDLAADSEVTLQLSGLGQPARSQPVASMGTGTEPGTGPGGWLGVPPVLAGLALMSAVAVHLRREQPAGLPPARPDAEAAEQAREALLLEMAELDEGFAANELEEGAYRKQRQAAKDRLLRLMAGSQDEGSDSSGNQARPDGGRRDGEPGKAVRPGGRARRRRPKGQRR